jgi:hypothetical protein
MDSCIDQPFDKVEKPEFLHLLEYTHLQPSLHIPYQGAIRTHIMKMGEDTVDCIKKMLKVCLFQLNFYLFTNAYCNCQELGSKVSLSLDAWTSSKKHPFLAIVMHYITNDRCLSMIYIHTYLYNFKHNTPLSQITRGTSN